MVVTPLYQSRKLKSWPTMDGVRGTMSTSRPAGSVAKEMAIPRRARCSSLRWKAMVAAFPPASGRRMALTRLGRWA